MIIKSISGMKKAGSALKGSIGFVPTMGYLHKGHLSLVKQAKKENDHAIVSIFVNPKQFGPKEDFQSYPRDTKRDIQMLETAGTDLLFLPEAEEMYPSGYNTYVNVQDITTRLEGKVRPGHFEGVTTVLTKLFNIIHPTKAYFGQKDAQQVTVVKKMVIDLNIPIKIVVGKTIRESDGLAMSSRNVFLDKSARKETIVLSQAIFLAIALHKKGESKTKIIKEAMEKLINKTSGNIDYISIADKETLKELEVIDKGALVSLAVRFGKTRLIDNILLPQN